ncbi:MAG: aminotransferase class V-fold PLP-dependent enzyme [Wigglesworthia glossinidia]|nr:aminotransferase class V-fold PLP-dependent enzyme [Wigglesworthia glossinidia]
MKQKVKFPIYLDYASTTPVDKKVYEKMLNYLTRSGIFGNPASSSHIYGWEAENAIEMSRKNVADLICANTREIIFTSGATESNNLAIKGVINLHKKQKIHIISGKTEHHSVLDTCYALQSHGIELSLLTPQKNGMILPEQLQKELRENTVLVSLMHVNNETGVIQDVESFGKICNAAGILFHVDATQSIGKIPIDLRKIEINLMSFNAHKIYGPKGIGVLFIRRKPPIYLKAQMHGGSQENSLRPGTLPVHQVVGMGEACRLIQREMDKENKKIKKLKKIFINGIRKKNDIILNGDQNNSVPHILNITFPGIDSRLIISLLKDLAISTGSACTSGNSSSSHVLHAMGISRILSSSSIRISLGKFISHEEILFTINYINNIIPNINKTLY